MTYVLAPQGKAIAYPYSFGDLRRDNPDVSFPREPDEDWLANWYGMHKVELVDRPSASSLEKNVVEGTPVLNNGVWTQVWEEVDASPDQIAVRQRRAADMAAHATIKADSFVANFVTMTPAQIISHIDSLPNNIAAMKNVVTKLALMLLLLARKEFRD